MKQYRIYIAGKLSDDACGYIRNLHRMCMWAVTVKGKGFSVFVPGLDFLMGFLIGHWIYNDYFDNNQAWVECSDAIFLVPGWTESKGVQKELVLARKYNIPSFTNIEELVQWCDEQKHEQTKQQHTRRLKNEKSISS